jgi:hypothetical protein
VSARPKELEGTWEEIITHASELAGQRVRLIILSSETEDVDVSGSSAGPTSSARSLLKYAGKWAGDDLEERLSEVYDARLPAEF